VAACLRRRVFDDALRIQENPNKDLIAKLVAQGKLPEDHRNPSILDLPCATGSSSALPANR
jgi:hypothetical protein